MRLYIGEVKKSVGRTFQDVEEENFSSLSWEGGNYLLLNRLR
jgi:hypothetical protein